MWLLAEAEPTSWPDAVMTIGLFACIAFVLWAMAQVPLKEAA